MDTETYRPLDLNKGLSPEIFGKECASCHADLDWIYFRRDSSMRDGHSHQCFDCEAAPRLSTAEHTARLREKNLNSEALKKQRWADQEELKNDSSRIGRPLMSADFLNVVKKLVPNLYVTEGRIIGHLAIFRTYGQPQPRLEGRDFEYMFYCPTGLLPEHSMYEFDHVRNIPIRESQRGWRTVLLRLIKAGLLSESTCDKVFGKPEGPSANRWNRELYHQRNKA